MVKKVVKRIEKRREIKTSPIVKKPQVEAPKEVPAVGPGCVQCGAPIMEGQTYVCKDHIRSN